MTCENNKFQQKCSFIYKKKYHLNSLQNVVAHNDKKFGIWPK